MYELALIIIVIQFVAIIVISVGCNAINERSEVKTVDHGGRLSTRPTHSSHALAADSYVHGATSLADCNFISVIIT